MVASKACRGPAAGSSTHACCSLSILRDRPQPQCARATPLPHPDPIDNINFTRHRMQRRELIAQGTPALQRRWLQQNPFAGAVLDDPTLPLPRFIRDTQQQPQQSPSGTSRKAEPIALKDALQQVKVLGVPGDPWESEALKSVMGG